MAGKRSDTAEYFKKDLKQFESRSAIRVPSFVKTTTRVTGISLLFIALLLIFMPWQQSSRGEGSVMAADPNMRVQNIQSPVAGKIKKWYVRDGSYVKEGEPIVELEDTDPRFMERLKTERDATFREYQAAKSATETALIDYNRQVRLYNEGLSSRSTMEKAKINYQKLLATESAAAASLAGSEVKLSRQRTQLVTAPQDGSVLRILHGSGSIIVKEGDTLAVFVPDALELAVEIYINGNDLPLIYPGRHVRLQFEGWPAVQFSGWPSRAVGTFGGTVTSVQASPSANGKFRVIAQPSEGEEWPSSTYLRQGTRVYGWILLNEVKLGYELWRQFNGFPLSLDKSPDKINGAK